MPAQDKYGPTPQPDRPPARQPRPSKRPTAPHSPAESGQTVALQLKLAPAVKLWLETQALGRSSATGRRITVSEVVTELVNSQPAGYTLHRPRTARDPSDAQPETANDAETQRDHPGQIVLTFPEPDATG